MTQWIEYKNVYAVKRKLGKMVNIRHVLCEDGITFEFGEKPSKRGSKRYKLTTCLFDKNKWTAETAYDWWTDHQIYLISKENLGKKIPDYDYWLENIDGKGTYLFACWKGAEKQICVVQALKDIKTRKEFKYAKT